MDKKKIELLYKTNYRRLFLVARSILMDDDESRDAVNEAFSRLLSSAAVAVDVNISCGGFEIRRDPAAADLHSVAADLQSVAADLQSAEAFLTVCVRNICLNMLKHKNIHERFAKMCFATQSTASQDDEYWRDKAAEVMNIVDSRFTFRMKRIFQLRFAYGMKYDEIAAELGVARMTVYNDLLRIVDLIKAKVKMP